MADDILMRIRKAKQSEFVNIFELAKSLFPEVLISYKEEDIFIIALKKEKIIGFVHISKVKNRVIIKGIGVASAFQNLGVGSALIGHVLTLLKDENEIYLKVKEANIPALSLYSKYGFFIKKYRRNYLLAKLKPT